MNDIPVIMVDVLDQVKERQKKNLRTLETTAPTIEVANSHSDNNMMSTDSSSDDDGGGGGGGGGGSGGGGNIMVNETQTAHIRK